MLRVKRLSVTSHNRGQGQYTPVSKTTDHDSAVRLIKSAQFQMRLWGRREVQYALVRLYCGRKYLFFFIHRFGFWRCSMLLCVCTVDENICFSSFTNSVFGQSAYHKRQRMRQRWRLGPPRLTRVVLTVAKWIPQPPP